MSPASSDPRKRARQQQNLRRGGPAPAAGNRLAVRHGGYARVLVGRLDEKVGEVYAALSEDAPLRDSDGGLPAADAVTVRLMAECLVRVGDISAWISANGWLDPNTGQPREKLLDLERRLRAEAADHADSMGMSPRSPARLGLDVARTAAFDLASEWADGDTIDGTAADA